MLTTTYAGYSDVGRKRSRNDDRWAADPALRLYLVADGVGSSTHGDRAAERVVELLPTYVARHLAGPGVGEAEAPARFGQAVVKLSEDLYAHSRRTESSLAGANTTVVATLIVGSRAVIAHLGDSRAYLYRHGRMQRLTSDHTIVQAVIDAGELSVEEAAHHPNRSVLTRHVLMAPPARPDVSVLDLQPGDRILLCSDGLHGLVNDEALAAILTDHPDPADACRALIDAANQAGGTDNITAVVVDAGRAPAQHRAPDRPPVQSARPPGRPTPEIGTAPAPPPPPPPPAPAQAPPAPPPPARPPRRRRGPRLGSIAAVVAVVAVLVAAAITGYLLWPRPRPTASHSQTVQPAQSPAPHGQTVLPFTGLNPPDTLAVDSAGNVYITDSGNNRVLKLATGGGAPTVLPFTGLNEPDGVAVDAAGNVYVADNRNNRVLRLGTGEGAQTELPFADLKNPGSVAVDAAGNVYVVDFGHNRVLKLAPGPDAEAQPVYHGLNLPLCVAADAVGNLYLTDNGTNQVLKLAAGSSTITPLPFTGLSSPHDVAVDAGGNVYAADFGNNRVLRLAAGSGTQTVLPFSGLSYPQGIAVDRAGNVFVTNTGNGRVVKLPAQ
jgi:serine/threonine protein phosphatase PrpC/DNA-binding beta-propeller fold protein YncE